VIAHQTRYLPGVLAAVLLSLPACDESDPEPAQGATWSACFASTADVDSCDAYCAQQGGHCATTCRTDGLVASEEAAALTWDGPACTCDNPRCPPYEVATGSGALCGARDFITDGTAYGIGSVQCCCAPGPGSESQVECDDVATGMWITQPVATPLCGGAGDYEELGFERMGDMGDWAVRWGCFDGELISRSGMAYALGEDGCSGTFADTFHFTIDGDVLTVLWSNGERDYQHAPEAPKRIRDPASGI